MYSIEREGEETKPREESPLSGKGKETRLFLDSISRFAAGVPHGLAWDHDFASGLIQLFLVNARRERSQQIEQRGIDGLHLLRPQNPLAQKSLGAAIKHAVLVPKGEDVLLDQAGGPIKHEQVISSGAGVLLQAERAIQERTHQDLRGWPPARHHVFMCDTQRGVEGDEGASCLLRIVEHDAERRKAEMADVEYLVCPPASVVKLGSDREIWLQDQHASIATARIVEQDLRLRLSLLLGLPWQLVLKIPSVDLPVAAQVVQELEMSQLQMRRIRDQAGLTGLAVVEKHPIAIRITQTTNRDLPGIMPECIVLDCTNGKRVGQADQQNFPGQS